VFGLHCYNRDVLGVERILFRIQILTIEFINSEKRIQTCHIFFIVNTYIYICINIIGNVLG